ncbi:bifunctional 4-hydroxy-2-oxoglutarate aldolase/2-dehydro-3-deoxy-phosphogluconate aldolase [Aquimarina gracilis]|uniref:Bifunctional 4-hydroxy-2-oxoglutarate aldolase/2-dehydro-3-deoxy-phosphogluconate aldolase n=1 Tax=Aquimarina gracilis TaxID=874422 RepID=A0ABU5ZQM9_9FLAO|nr:bifunctional 4-hydroxy-2-oxoglutarate aldolase/2-dehydro-3-deoxy-phosphogluconate aldolase [Aquimarina gracilis]MEB3344364.1 bifunctional 4-hydroxy-2-oxoglutarate aldolase/2-dehydro-3-deoxy-phosphogluconate aldolase [Aquimarina gracilis]
MIRVTKKEDIILIMESTGMIPVFNHDDIEIVKRVLDISYHAGVRIFEFTNRGDNALEVFTVLSRYAHKYDDLILGIGTIFDSKTALKFLNVGAQFIISPALVSELADFSKGNNVLWIPGCSTVSEVYRATKLGAPLIKAFPGNILGPAFVKAIKSVLPNVKIMPTGGVVPSRENLEAWFTAGANCVGMGSQLFKKEYLEKENMDQLSSMIRDTFLMINEIRK